MAGHPQNQATPAVACTENKIFTHIEILWGGSQTGPFGPVVLLCSVQKAGTSGSRIWLAARDYASFSRTSSSQKPLRETSAYYVILSVEPPHETWLSLRLHQ